VERHLEEAEGEITDEVDRLMATLEDLDVTAQTKMEAIAFYHTSVEETASMLEGLIGQVSDRLTRLKERKKAMDNQMSRLKESIINLMDVTNTETLDFQGKKIHVGKTKALVVLNEELAISVLPAEFIRTKEEVNKSELKKHIERTGVSYEGVELRTNKHLKGL
jgi:predicted lipase